MLKFFRETQAWCGDTPYFSGGMSDRHIHLLCLKPPSISKFVSRIVELLSWPECRSKSADVQELGTRRATSEGRLRNLEKKYQLDKTEEGRYYPRKEFNPIRPALIRWQSARLITSSITITHKCNQ